MPIKTLRVDPAVEKRQVQQMQVLRRKRNSASVKDALGKLRRIAEKDENLMPPIIEAVKEYATLGEICDVLRQVYGEYRAPTIF